LWNVNGLNTIIVTAEYGNVIIVVLYTVTSSMFRPSVLCVTVTSYMFRPFLCVTEWPPTCVDHFYVWQNDLHVAAVILYLLQNDLHVSAILIYDRMTTSMFRPSFCMCWLFLVLRKFNLLCIQSLCFATLRIFTWLSETCRRPLYI
jgi:hypothetical protein